MSEENKDEKPQPVRKTSAVPLRKETVRVTLKSSPSSATGPQPTKPVEASDSDAPTPPAPKPPTPSAPPAPTKGPDLPDVTSAVPLKQETMRVTLKADKEGDAPEAAEPKKDGPAAPPAPAPTIPLGGGTGAPKPPAAAPTVKLNTGSAPTGPATVPLATQPLNKPAASQPLPKATVQLEQTQQLSDGPTATQAPTIQTVVDEDSSASRGGNAAAGLAVAAFLVSLFVLFAQYSQASVWLESRYDGEFSSLFSGDN